MLVYSIKYFKRLANTPGGIAATPGEEHWEYNIESPAGPAHLHH